jgi:hypothetical protein
MQLSKVLLVIGATSVCLAPLPGRTAEKASVAPLVAPTPSSPDAVEKARAAMRQKMDELQPAAQAAPQAPAKAEPAPTPAPAPAPAPAQAAPTPSPAPMAEAAAPIRPVIPVANPEALEKAREALHQKMTELNSQPAPATVEQPAVASTKEPRKAEGASKFQDAKPKTAKELATNPTAKPMPSQVALTKEQPAKPTQEPKKAKAPEQPAVAPIAAKASTAFEPLSAPPSPLSATKQQRLNDLLTKYKADQLTPEQYHQERAKILAEP